MSSAGMVRGTGELLRAIAVRFGLVGGLAVAAWLAGAVTADAAEVPAHKSDPSPSAVAMQGVRSMDALVWAGTCGSAGSADSCWNDAADTDPATWTGSAYDSSLTAASAAATASGHAATASSGPAFRRPSAAHSAAGHSSALAKDPPAIGPMPSAAGDRPATQAGSPWSVGRLVGSQLAAVPTVAGIGPVIPGAGQNDRPAMIAAAVAIDELSVPGWSASSDGPGRTGPSGTPNSSNSAAPEEPTAAATLPPDRSSNSPPGVLGGERVAGQPISPVDHSRSTGTAATRAAHRSAHASSRTSAAADARLSPTPGDPHTAGRTGGPALPRPEPDPQPAVPAPTAPIAAPNGHSGVGGQREEPVVVFPTQPVPTGSMLVGADRRGGTSAHPGVLHRPTVSPD